jgi:nucleoside-diphosphate-sugar epimerase
MQKILITGSSGFIGSHLVEKMADRFFVVGFDKNPPSERVSNAAYVSGDITSLPDLQKAAEGVSGIIHLGAVSRVRDGQSDPVECIRVNVMGAVNVLEAARLQNPCPWIVFGSSIEAPVNIYGLSKQTAERFAERYADDFTMRILSLRFTTTYGSTRDNPEKLIPKLIRRALNRQEIVLDNAAKSFEFIHIHDLVEGVDAGVRYLDKTGPCCFEIIPLCTGNQTTLKHLAELIVAETDTDTPIVITDDHPEAGPVFSPKEAQDVLGYRAKIEITEGIRKTVRSFLGE